MDMPWSKLDSGLEALQSDQRQHQTRDGSVRYQGFHLDYRGDMTPTQLLRESRKGLSRRIRTIYRDAELAMRTAVHGGPVKLPLI